MSASSEKRKPIAPCWSGRIAKKSIAQLYEDDAQGMHDEELINKVAFTLFARCKSMLVAEAARLGQATYPVCEAIIEHPVKTGSMLACQKCDWAGSWDDYRGSMDGLHLIAPGLQPFCREYIRRLPLAASAKEKMYWIDWLIHRCHWEGTALPGQAGAVCLIQGRAQDVNQFLADLSAGMPRAKEAGKFDTFWSAEEHKQIRKWQQASERRSRKKRNIQITS